METVVRFSGSSNKDFQAKEAKWLLNKVLKPINHRIQKVCLYIEDVNGPRGGVDKECRCVLHINRMQPIVIREQDSGIRPLIHRAAKRAVRVLKQKFEHRKSARRRQRKSSRHNQEEMYVESATAESTADR